MIKVTISYVISGTYALNLFFSSFLYGKTSSKLDLKQLFSFYIPFSPQSVSFLFDAVRRGLLNTSFV